MYTLKEVMEQATHEFIEAHRPNLNDHTHNISRVISAQYVDNTLIIEDRTITMIHVPRGTV